MEQNKDNEEYISASKAHIDNFIRKNEYKKAFWLFILLLERLDDKGKSDIINYYSNNITLYNSFLAANRRFI